MADKKQYNMRNSAVKRILKEIKEMQEDSAKEYMSMPIEEDIFEWQFAIHGPADSEFEGGIYHGRIILPPEYPFKPPAFMLLTPSGRFEVQMKICLSISQHHPEHWQPSWSVRTALVALIAFMPTKPDGALGSLDYSKEERRMLAMKSRLAPPKFGSADRQKVINQIHEEMLVNAPPVPELKAPATPPGQPLKEAVSGEESEHQDGRSEPADANGLPSSDDCLTITDDPSTSDRSHAGDEVAQPSLHAEAESGSSQASGMGDGAARDAPASSDSGISPLESTAESARGISSAAEPVPAKSPHTIARTQTRVSSREDRALTMLAMALIVAIVALLVRKVLKVYSEGGLQDSQVI